MTQDKSASSVGIAMTRAMPGKEKSIYRALKESDGTVSIHHAFGEYDFLVMIQADGMPGLERVLEEIKGLPEVADARAIVAMGMLTLSDLPPAKCQADCA